MPGFKVACRIVISGSFYQKQKLRSSCLKQAILTVGKTHRGIYTVKGLYCQILVKSSHHLNQNLLTVLLEFISLYYMYESMLSTTQYGGVLLTIYHYEVIDFVHLIY